MSIREALARWICPELGKNADRWWRALVDIQELKQWVGHDFPMIEVALDRLTIGVHNYSRSLNEKSLRQEYPRLGGLWPEAIYPWREKLQQTFLRNGDCVMDAPATVYLREVDSGTDNACWVVCTKSDPGSVTFVEL